MRSTLVMLCLVVSVRLGMGQVMEDPVFASIKKVVVDAQREVKPMKGPEAYQCFTDDDKKRFDKNEDAKRIAAKAVSSPEFESAIKDLSKKGKDYQRNALERLRAVRDKTYAEAGHYGSDVQTDAGAEAQSQIASEIVEIMRSRLPCCKH